MLYKFTFTIPYHTILHSVVPVLSCMAACWFCCLYTVDSKCNNLTKIIMYNFPYFPTMCWRWPRPVYTDEQWVVYAEWVWGGFWSIEQQGLETQYPFWWSYPAVPDWGWHIRASCNVLHLLSMLQWWHSGTKRVYVFNLLLQRKPGSRFSKLRKIFPRFVIQLPEIFLGKW